MIPVILKALFLTFSAMAGTMLWALVLAILMNNAPEIVTYGWLGLPASAWGCYIAEKLWQEGKGEKS